MKPKKKISTPAGSIFRPALDILLPVTALMRYQKFLVSLSQFFYSDMDKILRGYYETPEIAVIPIRSEGVICLTHIDPV